MRGWTETENVKAKRFPGMERVKKERERGDPEEWGTLEKNREWRDGLNVSDIQPTLWDPRESRVRSALSIPLHITAPFQAAQHLFPSIKTNNLLCQESQQPLSVGLKGPTQDGL